MSCHWDMCASPQTKKCLTIFIKRFLSQFWSPKCVFSTGFVSTWLLIVIPLLFYAFISWTKRDVTFLWCLCDLLFERNEAWEQLIPEWHEVGGGEENRSRYDRMTLYPHPCMHWMGLSTIDDICDDMMWAVSVTRPSSANGAKKQGKAGMQQGHDTNMRGQQATNGLQSRYTV